VLWTPSQADLEREPVTTFRKAVEREHGLELGDYRALWRWSVEDAPRFWRTLWRFFDLGEDVPKERVLQGSMPDARWFEGKSINYAEQVFRRQSEDRPPSSPAARTPIRSRSASRTCARRWLPWQRRCVSSASSPAIGSRGSCRTGPRP
jgi:hypothetical protein